MPALSPTMEAGTIAAWKLAEGDSFKDGDVIAEVETDKATVDMVATDDGVLAKILVPAGSDEVMVGAPVLVVCEEVSDVAAFADYKPEATAAPAPAPAAAAPTPAPAPVAAPTPAPIAAAPAAPSASGGGLPLIASPLARHLAAQAGFDLTAIGGTGPGGRVVADDVRAFVPAPVGSTAEMDVAPTSAAAAAGSTAVVGDGFVDYQLGADAAAIAARLAHASATVPHYYLSVDVELTATLALLEHLNTNLSEDAQIGLGDALIKASALAMHAVPDANAAWLGSAVRQYKSCDINVVVGVGDGLVAPVVRDAGKTGLAAIAAATKGFVAGAADGSLGADTLACGTFTIMNLGSFGVASCAPLVHTPQACALALGAVEDRVLPAVGAGADEPCYRVAPCASVTLSCDHRVIDGAVGAAWLAAFKGFVESPQTMLL